MIAVADTVDASGNQATGFLADALASVDLGGNLQFITRPYLQRAAATGDWNARFWMAALRYERPGRVGLRIDGGYIPSPIGLANLLLRPHLNPVIAQPASLFTSLPSPAPRGPDTNLLRALYPAGVSVTASTQRLDVRAAVIDRSPVRPRTLFAGYSSPDAPRLANLVLGGGVTPLSASGWAPRSPMAGG